MSDDDSTFFLKKGDIVLNGSTDCTWSNTLKLFTARPSSHEYCISLVYWCDGLSFWKGPKYEWKSVLLYQ